MRNCQFCYTELQKEARFCHHCGAKVKQTTQNCSHCQESNTMDAQFCVQCGSGLGEIPVQASRSRASYDPLYPLDFRIVKDLGANIRQYFVVELDKRISSAHNSDQKEAYLNHLMRSDFQEIFQLRTNQLAEEAYTIHTKQEPTLNQDVDEMLSRSFDGLLDFFFIKYCKEINEYPIPEAALKYEGAKFDQTNLFQLITEYLALEEEELDYYNDLLKMPLAKLQNAGRYYLFPAKDEKIILICDQTVFGSCKEGFALTEAALYWKAHFKPAKKVYFKDIESIQKEGEYITINGLFFNASPSLNIKMIYLLNRLKRMF